MKKNVALTVSTLLIAAGVATGIVIVVLVFLSNDRFEAAETYGSLAGIGGVAALAGLLLMIGTMLGDRRDIRIPFYWIGLIVFGALIAVGFVLSVSDLPPVAAPFLAVLAAASLAIFYAGLLLRWSPAENRLLRAATRPMTFGMTGSVLIAVSMQIVFVVAIVAGVVVGFSIAGVDIPNSNTFQELFAEFDEGAGTIPEALFTPTVLFAAFALFVVVAPLTEELTKFFGAFVPLFKQPELSRYTVFLAGAMAGLGFATTENIGYALLSPAAWAPTMLLRAPVVLVHMAASSIVAVGWYQQRTTGRLSLLWFFALAVVLHGSFNAVIVAATFTAGSVGTESNASAGAALTVMLLLGSAGAILTSSLVWLVLNARRFGRDATTQSTDQSHPEFLWEPAAPSTNFSSVSGRAFSSTLN